MAVPVTPRRDEEVTLIETTDASRGGVELDIGALNTPDTASSCRHAAHSTEEGEAEQSDAVKPEVKASHSAAPSGSTKTRKNRKMKNLVKPAQSPVLGEEQGDALAAEGSGIGLIQPRQVEPAGVVTLMFSQVSEEERQRLADYRSWSVRTRSSVLSALTARGPCRGYPPPCVAARPPVRCGGAESGKTDFTPLL